MRLGTRGSALALAQARLVADLLGGAEIVSTAELAAEEGGGAQEATEARDKSRWVRDLERSLLAGRIDLAVHSAKDLPGELPAGLELLGSPGRGPVEDVLVGAGALASLAAGSRIGTSSLRRTAQLMAARPDLEVVTLSGNVDTRLRKLTEPAEELDAIVLARAGLDRLGLEPQPMVALDTVLFTPAPGQGALALEGRNDDESARAAAAAVTDEGTFACLLAERSLARALDASCNTPIGAHAERVDTGGGAQAGTLGMTGATGGALVMRAWVGLPDGSAWVRDELAGDAGEAEALGRHMAERMRSAGAGELLEEAEEMVVGRA